LQNVRLVQKPPKGVMGTTGATFVRFGLVSVLLRSLHPSNRFAEYPIPAANARF